MLGARFDEPANHPPPPEEAAFFARIAPLQVGMDGGFERARFADEDLPSLDAGAAEGRRLVAARGADAVFVKSPQAWGTYEVEDLDDRGMGLAGAFAHDLWEVRHDLAPERALEIGIGFVTAFLAALLVVKPFLRFVGRSGFAPFAWYRIVAGVLILVGIAAGVL